MAANRKKGMFNWQGIDENSDGTYTAQGRIEKRRLLKELHRQGVAIRSKHNDDGTWTVSPIGMRAPRRAVGHRPRTRYPVSRPRQDLRQPLRSLFLTGNCLVDDIERTSFLLNEDPSNVFTDHSKNKKLEAGYEHHQGNQTSPTGNHSAP